MVGMKITDLNDHVEHVRARCLQEALATGTAAYWRRRAATFRWVAEVAVGDRRERNLERAQACENAAHVAEFPYDPEAVIADRLEEYHRWHDAVRFARVGEVAA